MRSKKLLCLAILLGSALSMNAQYIPSHGKYVSHSDKGGFLDYFETWEPGTQISEDDNFFISRVKLKERFVNRNTQVIKDNEFNNNREFCMFTPMGISESYWQTLPRYVFDGDNFGMWSYIDYQGGWSQSWIRATGAYSDICHKNGVANGGGVVFFDGWNNDNTEAAKIFNMVAAKNEDGTFKYVDKFIKFIRYYGIDGVGVNPEGTIRNAPDMQDFFAAVTEKAPQYGWKFHVYWYATNNNYGWIDQGSDLTTSKSDWFIKNGKTVCDVYFLNYGWGYTLDNSIDVAEKIRKGSSYRLFAGYDIQGGWMGVGSWKALAEKPVSICFWGNHSTDMIYQNSSERGSNDEAVQYCYLDKQEQVFSGGTQNPANAPAIVDEIREPSTAAMKNFHGVASLLPARSSLQELPFVTRFSLGNGKVFRNAGKVTFNHKWYHLGSQDYLPTWRWWITNEKNEVPDDAIKCTFTFEDSWFAGSCMRVYGKTLQSNVRLFKTNFNVSDTDDVNLTYKVNNGINPHMKLFWSFVGSEDKLYSVEIPAAQAKGKWTTASFKASSIGMKGNVALLGFTFENTQSDYEILIGELGIVPQKTFNPLKPVITKSEFLGRTYNSLDFKMIWKSKDQDVDKKDLPVYNDEVDTWYFEVWSQAKGDQPKLCGITTSWAHYIVGAHSDPFNKEYRMGVCAVAPDGKTKSEIAWSDYAVVEAGMVDGIVVDKPVIKAGEQFTVKFKDPLHAEAQYWMVNDALTGEPVTKGKEGGTSYTLSLDTEGYYDVVVTDEENNELAYRGIIQISPMETGALPIIRDFVASPTDVTVDNPLTEITYEADRLGEGTVSRGLEVNDPYMLRIPSEALPATQKTYSVGLWVKPIKFSHNKYGTNLLNKRKLSKAWPNNNWGAFWVHVWQKHDNSVGREILSENIVSYSMFGNEAKVDFNGNNNKHEVPNLFCCTDGHRTNAESYCLGLNTWSHILISYDGTNQRIYFNGKKVGDTTADFREYEDCPIYVGGSNVYHSGLFGVIDDVQVWSKALTEEEVVTAMGGYVNKEIPTELVGYWTFDDYDGADSTFINKGSKGDLKEMRAKYIEFEGAAGENTSSTVEKTILPNNHVLGNPALPGTLEIKTSAIFDLPGTVSTENMVNGVKATYGKTGNFNVKLTLKNLWGSSVMEKQEYIVATGFTSIENETVARMSVYPNPFVEGVNIYFPEGGSYAAKVVTMSGTVLTEECFNAEENEVKRVSIGGAQGVYLLQLLKDGRCLKTVKLQKR